MFDIDKMIEQDQRMLDKMLEENHRRTMKLCRDLDESTANLRKAVIERRDEFAALGIDIRDFGYDVD